MSYSPKSQSPFVIKSWSGKKQYNFYSNERFDIKHLRHNKNETDSSSLNTSTNVSDNEEKNSIHSDEVKLSTSSSSSDCSGYDDNFEDWSVTKDPDYSAYNSTIPVLWDPRKCQTYDILFRPSIIKNIKEKTLPSIEKKNNNCIIEKSEQKKENPTTSKIVYSKKCDIERKHHVGTIDKEIKIRKNNPRYEKLVRRSRARRNKKGFDAPTMLAEAKIVKREIKEEIILTLEERNQLEKEKFKRVAEQRKKHKLKLKKTLTHLEESKQIMNKAEEEEKEEIERRRKRITKKVLEKIKMSKHKNAQIDSGPPLKSDHITSKKLKVKKHKVSGNSYNLLNEVIIADTSYDEDEIKNSVKERKIILNELKKKSIAHIAEIQNKRYVKELTAERDRKRNLKQKLILRNQYLKNEKKDEQQEDHSFIDIDPVVRPNEEVSLVKSTKVLSLEEVTVLAQRLSQRKNDEGLYLPSGVSVNLTKWKRQNNVLSDQKVFCLSGWYPSVKDNLLERGWFFNTDNDSMFFDLKWTLSSTEVQFDSLQTTQRVNHFQNSGALTTKAGLIRTLRSLRFLTDEDENAIFPRSYDLTSFSEVKEFMNDYHSLKAEMILRNLIQNEKTAFVTADSHEEQNECLDINIGVFEILVNVLEKKIQDIIDGDFISYDAFSSHPCLISEEEGEIIDHAEKWLYQKVFIDVNDLPCTSAIFDIEIMSRNIIGNKPSKSKNKTQNEIKEDEEQRRKISKSRTKLVKRLTMTRNLTAHDLKKVKDILNNLQNFNNNEHQSKINGSLSNNLWIVKPASKSRGRGIRVFKDLDKILKYINVSNVNKSVSPSSYSYQWTIQKYIENPMTIAQRKFDIRQWVLVTSWNPLIVWFYNDCYIRFAVEQYDDQINKEKDVYIEDNDESWTTETYRHLVNNSISKHNPNFHKSFQAENGVEVLNHMWSLQSFQKWLIHQSNKKEIWDSCILPQIQNIVKKSTICAQEHVIHLEGSWELYGYDLMIDQSYHVWLIEVNSSPACDYSTSIAKNFVTQALPDILKVVLDENDCNTDTGDWNKLYHGREIQNQTNLLNLNIDLSLTGQKIYTNKVRKTKQPQKQNQKEKHLSKEHNDMGKKNRLNSLDGNCIEEKDNLESKSDKISLVKRNKKNHEETYDNNKENNCSTFKPIDKTYSKAKDKKKLIQTKIAVPLKTIVLDM